VSRWRSGTVRCQAQGRILPALEVFSRQRGNFVPKLLRRRAFLGQRPIQPRILAPTRGRRHGGSLFEQYIVWLFKQFSRDTEIEIVHSFRIELPENQSKGPESPERDIALFAGARAFVFEVKSSIPTIAHRRRAEVDDLPFHPRKSGSPGCVAENFVAFAGDA